MRYQAGGKRNLAQIYGAVTNYMPGTDCAQILQADWLGFKHSNSDMSMFFFYVYNYFEPARLSSGDGNHACRKKRITSI